MIPHPECRVGHHPPEHPCEWPDCRCFDRAGRRCYDCGIAAWQECICTDAGSARVDHERDHSTLIAIHHAVDAEAERQITSVDPAFQPVTEAQRVMALAARLGAVADCVRENGCLDIEAALVALCAEGQNWVEALAREGRSS